MTAIDLNEPAQIEPNPAAPVGTNPAKQAFNIAVSVPEQITIKMVDASSLADYEINIFVASLLFGGFTGFLVPAIQETRAESALAVPFCMMTALVGVMFIIFLAAALVKRKKLSKGGKEIKLATTGATLE